MAMAAVLRREGRRLTQPINALHSSLISQSRISNFDSRSHTLFENVFLTETKPLMVHAPFPLK
ncbi:unnamed protein product [Sphenostylis stenocarpa]|uniref:Uncharacterized protein n=1 Tax=Sphenostylis stenocarpa TaxID=92480 RepID=A0AA86SYU8_9FABA|nr:unnamed protein product [Sphenostylis stenocarpa]